MKGPSSLVMATLLIVSLAASSCGGSSSTSDTRRPTTIITTGSVTSASTLSTSTTAFTDLQDMIRSALDAGKATELEGHMAASVEYAIAASGAFGTLSAADAATRIASYFKEARGPWDLAIPSATLDIYKHGQYQRYLSDATYFGATPGKQFISLRVNAAGRIDQVFVAASTDLLR